MKINHTLNFLQNSKAKGKNKRMEGGERTSVAQAAALLQWRRGRELAK